MDEERAAIPVIEARLLVPFAVVASLFFSWALANSLNDVLIRHFQKALDLSRGQSGFIQFAFYIGYFCAALPAGWVVRRTSYKACMLFGLGMYVAGAVLFWPAAVAQSFPIFLCGLYVIAFGLAFLETAANPYAAALGDPRTGAARLNLAQSFNGLGIVVGPLIGGLFILSGVEHSSEALNRMSAAELAAYRASEAANVIGPYLALAAFIALLFLLVALTPLPAVGEPCARQGGGVAGALKHRQLRRALVAQFFYVGAQVSLWSYFIDFCKEVSPATPERSAAFLLSASFATFFVGRLIGSWLVHRFTAPRMLLLYASATLALCVGAALLPGLPAIAAWWATSFFLSIMFPTIFALGVQDLGPDTSIGSSLLIMSIVGGAIMPPVAGGLADLTGSMRASLVLPMLSFIVVAWFARKQRDAV